MSILLQQLKCPHCGAPIKSKTRDRILQCDHCDSLSLFEKGKMNPVTFSIAKPVKESTEKLIFVPFWIVDCNVDVHYENISGGGIRRMIKGQKKMRGNQMIYICASSAIPEKFSRDWNMSLTLEKPSFEMTSDMRRGERMPMTMDEEIAGNNAEFIFLRYETDLAGTLQDLDYDFIVNSTEVVYLPVYKIDVDLFEMAV